MKNLPLKLFVSLVVFAFVLIVAMVITTTQLFLSNTIEEQEHERASIERNIVTQLSQMDSAHAYFVQLEDEEMRDGLYKLRDYYEQNPAIYTWDLAALKKDIGNREFYIIDENNRIVVTTHEPSRGLDFKKADNALYTSKRRGKDTYTFEKGEANNNSVTTTAEA